MIQYLTDKQSRRRRVHKVYVPVVARFAEDGSVDPVSVGWRDGRTFPIDEVMEPGELSADVLGYSQARYRVRMRRHKTYLFLQRRRADEATGTPDTYRWWVMAYDREQPKPGAANRAPSPAGQR